MRYTRTKIVDNSKLMQCIASPFHKDHTRLMSEDPNLQFYEIQQRPRKIKDNKPVHVGIAILQYSKLHFLKFIYWLHEHLVPNSYYLCYADTDSIFIGKIYIAVTPMGDKNPLEVARV